MPLSVCKSREICLTLYIHCVYHATQYMYVTTKGGAVFSIKDPFRCYQTVQSAFVLKLSGHLQLIEIISPWRFCWFFSSPPLLLSSLGTTKPDHTVTTDLDSYMCKHNFKSNCNSILWIQLIQAQSNLQLKKKNIVGLVTINFFQ